MRDLAEQRFCSVGPRRKETSVLSAVDRTI